MLFVHMEHFWDLLFQLMKHGTKTLHVPFIFLFSVHNIHYMSKSMLVKHLIPKSWALIWSWSPLCCYNSLHSSANIAAGTCFHSATKALVSLDTYVVRLGLARSRPSNSSQRCLIYLRSELCAGQSSSSTLILTNHFCMDHTLCTGALSC